MTNIEIFILNTLLICAIYYLIVNSIYFTLITLSFFSIKRQRAFSEIVKYFEQSYPPFLPSVSIIVPAYNEENNISQSVQSFLSLQYPNHEVVVIDDGSTDDTLKILIDKFLLYEAPLPAIDEIESVNRVLRGYYKSSYHDNLTVISRSNGGKARSLNLGIVCSNYELVCAVDADSVIEENALVKVVTPFMEDPDRIVAVGGTIRIVNGSVVDHGLVKTIELSKSWIAKAQVIEYTRSFLCGRTGWNALNSNLIISGAFGIFNKKIFKAIGGYRNIVGEDMELITRLHKFIYDNTLDYKVLFIPDPVCWTEAPESWVCLKNQRDRWQRGLAESILGHKKMLLNPKYNSVGMVAFPYMFFVELLGPFIEVISIIAFIVACSMGLVNSDAAYLYILCSFAFTMIISALSLAVDEFYYSKYSSLKNYFKLLTAVVYEIGFYRYLISIWRLVGLFKYILKKDHKKWGKIQRAGFRST